MSRDLDAEVAEKVMGWIWLVAIVPHYSSTWSGMELVVERMAALGWDCEMQVCEGFGTSAEFTAQPDRRAIHSSGTLPECVCRAALAALAPASEAP
ncbi:MAG TPA: hypothetical protein VK681_39160 [Reyranella sp.]|nr:hypothetical protein [Reyranella sp.]